MTENPPDQDWVESQQDPSQVTLPPRPVADSCNAEVSSAADWNLLPQNYPLFPAQEVIWVVNYRWVLLFHLSCCVPHPQ